MTTERTDDEINRSIAELMGWIYERHPESRPGKCVGRALPHWHAPDGRAAGEPPNFTHDLNALRDGPERVLREAGCLLRVYYFPDHVLADWRVPRGGGGAPNIKEGQALDEARARALAAEAALTVITREAAPPAAAALAGAPTPADESEAR